MTVQTPTQPLTNIEAAIERIMDERRKAQQEQNALKERTLARAVNMAREWMGEFAALLDCVEPRVTYDGYGELNVLLPIPIRHDLRLSDMAIRVVASLNSESVLRITASANGRAATNVNDLIARARARYTQACKEEEDAKRRRELERKQRIIQEQTRVLNQSHDEQEIQQAYQTLCSEVPERSDQWQRLLERAKRRKQQEELEKEFEGELRRYFQALTPAIRDIQRIKSDIESQTFPLYEVFSASAHCEECSVSITTFQSQSDDGVWVDVFGDEWRFEGPVVVRKFDATVADIPFKAHETLQIKVPYYDVISIHFPPNDQRINEMRQQIEAMLPAAPEIPEGLDHHNYQTALLNARDALYKALHEE